MSPGSPENLHLSHSARMKLNLSVLPSEVNHALDLPDSTKKYNCTSLFLGERARVIRNSMSAPAREDTDRLKKKRETLVDNCSVSHLTGEVMRKSQMTCLKSCETATNPRTVLRPAVTFVLQGLLHAHLSSRYMARCTPIQHFLSSNTCAH